MELTVPLDEHLRRSAALHSRLCPRQVIGVRMARFACLWFGVDPALERRRIYVFMETGRCAADGVIAVTNASPTNQLMQLMPYGKVAATFVDLQTREALRVSENPASRTIALTYRIAARSIYEQQLQEYQVMDDDVLLRWQSVTLEIPIPVSPKKHAVHCAQCGDRIHDHEEVIRGEASFCKACALGAYYTVQPTGCTVPL